MTIYKIQLMAYGEQDYYLTGNPQISFFKKIYRRHTHFSREKLDINFTKDGGLSKFSSHFKAIIPRKGELLSGLSLEIDITCENNGNETGKSFYTVNNFINSLIKHSKIKINEYTIEEYISQWRQIKHELTHKSTDHYNYMSSELYGGKQTEFNFTRDTNRTYISNEDIIEGFSPLIVGGSTALNEYKPIGNTRNIIGNATPLTKKLIYNFDFWFTRNIGMALPIVCLYNNEVMLEFDTEKKDELIGNVTSLTIDKIVLKGDFIHLYGDEKRRFTNSSHEYLIEQLQYNDRLKTMTSTETPLPSQTVNINNLKHPIKYITWAVQNKGTNTNNPGQGPCYFVSMTNSNLYGNDGTQGSFHIQLNGTDSYRNMPMIYYTRHNTKHLCDVVPALDRIGLFSFCLNPFDSHPSGTCNMSKIRDKKLQFVFSNNKIDTISNKNLFIFAVNYNVFKINSNGMGGLLFE
jgi:hypothetical protein